MNAAQSDPRAGTQPDPLVRVAVVGAPALMLGYGVLRLVDGIDGEYGPGLAWTAGHVLFLMSLLLFVALHIGFRRLVPATRPVHQVIATVAAIVGILGLIAFVRVILIDIVVGLRAADQAEMSDLSDRLADIPG